MYVARHSWASVARGKHIPLSVISEGRRRPVEKKKKKKDDEPEPIEFLGMNVNASGLERGFDYREIKIEEI